MPVANEKFHIRVHLQRPIEEKQFASRPFIEIPGTFNSDINQNYETKNSFHLRPVRYNSALLRGSHCTNDAEKIHFAVGVSEPWGDRVAGSFGYQAGRASNSISRDGGGDRPEGKDLHDRQQGKVPRL